MQTRIDMTHFFFYFFFTNKIDRDFYTSLYTYSYNVKGKKGKRKKKSFLNLKYIIILRKIQITHFKFDHLLSFLSLLKSNFVKTKKILN